jgi:CheY-like chemotaxis protein
LAYNFSSTLLSQTLNFIIKYTALTEYQHLKCIKATELQFGAQPAVRGIADSSGKSHALRILLIDDMGDLAKLTCLLLTLKGYEVNVFNSGRDGVAAVELQKPDVVLCDIGMPELDGYQTAQLFREGKWGSSVILIALSGYGQEEDKRQAKMAGFDGHLTKPLAVINMQSLIMQLAEGAANK